MFGGMCTSLALLLKSFRASTPGSYVWLASPALLPIPISSKKLQLCFICLLSAPLRLPTPFVVDHKQPGQVLEQPLQGL